MKAVILISVLTLLCCGMANSEQTRKIPDSIDWNALGKVTPVIDQNTFNHSSLLYHSVGVLESRSSIQSKSGDLVPFSVQQIVDCTVLTPDSKIEEVFKYIKEKKGLSTAASYPEIANKNSKCLADKGTIGVTLSDFVILPKGDEEALKAAVAEGPVFAQVDGSQKLFTGYVEGVYYEEKCVPDQLSHNVLVVGYGTEDGEDYWLVKNSWGTDWGINGYIKMARNKNNNCNIASHAIYPVL